jgi:hypothetical protein
VGVGTPAIAFAESWAQKFVIFVRAKNQFNQYRVYETFFDHTTFTSAAGGAWSYQQMTFPAGAPAIQSDPAYEYDSNMFAATFYYRGNTSKIYQMTANVDDFGPATLKQIDLGNITPTITGNPVVVGGVPYEAGRHWVLARGGSNLYFAESFNDENLTW